MVSIESNHGYLSLHCVSPVTGNTFASLIVFPSATLFYHDGLGAFILVTPELGANLVDLLVLCDDEKFPHSHTEYLMSRLFTLLRGSKSVNGMRALPTGIVYTPQAMWEMLNSPTE